MYFDIHLRDNLTMKLLKLFIVVSVLHLLIVVIHGNAVFAIDNSKNAVPKGDINLIIPTESAAIIAPVEESIVSPVDNLGAKKHKIQNTESFIIASDDLYSILHINLFAVQYPSISILSKVCCYRK